MKPSPSILIAVALFAFIAGNATPKVATASSPMCASLNAAWHSLPLPVVHLRFSGASITIEHGYHPASARTTKALQPVTLRITVTRTAGAELLLRSRHFRFAVPRRSA